MKLAWFALSVLTALSLGCARGEAEAAPSASESALGEQTVRSVGWPFGVQDGVIFRLDVTSDRRVGVLVGKVDDPSTDTVLATLPPWDQGIVDIDAVQDFFSMARIVVRQDYVYVFDDVFKVFRVARDTGSVDTILACSETRTMEESWWVFESDGALLELNLFGRITRLRPPATTWEEAYVQELGEHQSAFAMTVSGNRHYFLDPYWGPYTRDLATRQTKLLGERDEWLSVCKGAGDDYSEMLEHGNALLVLCNGRELSKWDLSGAHPAKLLAKFPGTGKWSNLRADGGFAYMQSTTDGVILKMNLTTGAITRLVERHHPVPNPDKWDEDPVRWQLKSPFSIDGQFLYYLDGDAIRRVAK